MDPPCKVLQHLPQNAAEGVRDNAGVIKAGPVRRLQSIPGGHKMVPVRRGRRVMAPVTRVALRATRSPKKA